MNSVRNSTKIKYKKEPIRTEEYNNYWQEKYTRRNQQEIRGCRRTDQWSGKQDSRNHPIRTAKRNKKKMRIVRDLWNIKCNNIHLIGIPEKEERAKDRKINWRNNGWKFP